MVVNVPDIECISTTFGLYSPQIGGRLTPPFTPLLFRKMQITKISFGVTVSRDYQAKRYDLEAVLEPWENHEESFRQLRDKVCELANVHPSEYPTAAEKAEDLKVQISENQKAIEERRAENNQLITELIGLRKTKQRIVDFSDAISQVDRHINYNLTGALSQAIKAYEKLIPLLPQEEKNQPQSDLESEIEPDEDEDEDDYSENEF